MREYKDQRIELCEMGLFHPAAKRVPAGSYDRALSLFMWRDYFRNGQITGFDIDDFSSIKKNRLRIFRGDQSNRDHLCRLAPAEGKTYDFIIDDESHASNHQQISLGYLFKFLRPGGIYFVEDLGWQPRELEPPSATKTLAFLEKLKYFHKVESNYLLEDETQYLERHVDQIIFYDSLAHNSIPDSMAVLIKK